ncbi:MAG TPA: extracellular solute-binding protein [Candidatus Limiplasma sp.]|nr:extracellular solute-binding protein [Candidatus Limiplasma sp.]
MKKLLVYLLCATLLFGMGISSAAAADSEELTTVLYVVPGDEPKDLEGGLQAINDKLLADGVGVQLELKYIPWDAWDQKINIMLSTGEAFDLFQVMNDRVSLSNYASRGALADISEAVQEYGENILAVNPDIMMKSGQVDGVQYAIPAYWVESALDPEITIRKDILEKYDLEVPTTFEELTAAFITVMENWDGVQKPYIPMIGSNTSRFGLASMTYDEWPYVIYDKVFLVTQDGTVSNYFASDIFKKDCANARLWYESGLISPDVLTTTSDQLNNQLNSGDWFVHAGTVGDITQIQNNYPDITTDDFINLNLAPEKTRIRPYGTRNMNAVPAASEHPEAAVKFLNWVYASQENYDLMIYGREGIDYTIVGDRSISIIADPITGAAGYSFADWMLGNVTFLRTSITAPKATVDALYTLNDTAVEGYAAKFTFDASNVQTQYADVMTQISAVIAPIACGVLDYDANIDDALAMLQAAGVDELIAEFQAQLDASKAE